MLEENGFHRAKLTVSEKRDEREHQADITFHVAPGPRATVGEIIVKGDASYGAGEMKDIAGLHTGDPVIATHATRALQRIRSRYQKQDRLLAQVSLADRTYNADRNTVDFTFEIERGPVVEVAVRGIQVKPRHVAAPGSYL